ncbi:MOP flippase [Armillaria novae-zelandiae]|uniref:MOP flippase n=1 Tax=Armillaria novae-zelandiae TaxID=153914 RepID=A0AA39PRH1_9AGAR|nr:MOP flippase [Armillaria novae-zelandiae]
MASHLLANETTPLLQNSLESETENEADVSRLSTSTDGLLEGENVSRALGPHVSLRLFGSLFVDSIPGWCVALGGTTALDTLGSQAFTGGSRPTDLSIHFQRCIILLWILLIPVCILWAFIGPILLALGIMGASTTVLAVVFPVNIALNVLFVHFTSLGLLGSPVALSLTYWIAFALLSVYTAWSPTHRQNGCWGGLQLGAVFHPHSCYLFLKLAIPGILMVGTEWAAFEIVALAAGRLGSLPLAAQSVIMTTDQILNTLPFGIGVAASNRVGNLIGARSPVGAKNAAHASALLSMIVGLLVMTVMMATKDVYGYLFSDDEGVVDLVSEVMPLVASFQVADGLAGSCGGVLRGQGRQHLGALFNLGAYYVLALPMGITLAFRYGLGLQGLWIGQVVALFIVGLGEYLVVWLGTDWDLEVQRGVDRNQEEAKRRSIDRASGEGECNMPN